MIDFFKQQVAKTLAKKEKFYNCVRSDEEFIVYNKNTNHYLSFNDFQLDNLTENIVMLMKNLPVKESDKRIAFVIDSFFIGNTSGIFTFVKHFAKMCQNLGYVLDLIVDQYDGIEVPRKFDTSNVSYFYTSGFHDTRNLSLMYKMTYESKVRPEIFARSFKNYLTEFKPIAVVSHSFSSTIALYKLKPLLDELGIKPLAYTHIGDIMCPNNVDLLDFGDDITLNYIRLLKHLPFSVGTQTLASQKALDKMHLKSKPLLLPEPYYEPQSFYKTPSGTRGVLIVSSNYERKRFDLMFEILSITGLPVTVVCGLAKRKKDQKSLRQMAMDAGVQGYRQINDLPNDLMVDIIKQHRVLLHMSEIEVMPYAILEASSHIPCIVNKNAPYTDGIPGSVVKIDPDDMYECVSTIMEVYGDTYEYLSFDSREYVADCEQIWSEFLGI